MVSLPRTVDINIAAVAVRGFGGACLVLASLICAAVLPETRVFMAAATATGALWGALMIAIRRRGER
jgi:hypothetical protein